MVDWRHYGEEEKRVAKNAFKRVINAKIYDMDFRRADDFYDLKLPLHSAIKFYLHCVNSLHYAKSRRDLFIVMLKYFSFYDFFSTEFLEFLYDKHLYTIENSEKQSLYEDSDYSNNSTKNIKEYIYILRYIFLTFGKKMYVYQCKDILFAHEKLCDFIDYSSKENWIKKEDIEPIRNIFREDMDFYFEKGLDFKTLSELYKLEKEEFDKHIPDIIINWKDILDTLYEGNEMVMIGCEDFKPNGYLTNILYGDLQHSYESMYTDVSIKNNCFRLVLDLNSFVYNFDCIYIITIICALLLDYGWCNLLKIDERGSEEYE